MDFSLYDIGELKVKKIIKYLVVFSVKSRRIILKSSGNRVCVKYNYPFTRRFKKDTSRQVRFAMENMTREEKY